jgi:DNA polymerase III epsilon subunit-like protein
MIPAAASDIHGISDAAVADAPSWDEVYPLVGRILDSYGPVVVYNADFDRRILSQTNALYGLPDFDAEWHCAMRQFAAYEGTWHEKYRTWRWHKLTTALEMLGEQTPSVQHRALQDTWATRQIVESMAAGIVPEQPAPSYSPAVIPPDRERREQRGEPIRPDVIGPGDEERFGDAPRGWETRSGQFPGGQFTVISTRTQGCSPGLLAAILIGGAIAIGVGCCAFFYLFAQLIWA